MLKEATDYVKNRDDLRRLDILQQKKLQNKVASKIASFDEDIVLVDTHAQLIQAFTQDCQITY